MINIAILMMIWIISCVFCYVIGGMIMHKNYCGEKKQKRDNLKINDNKEQEKFMKELENLFNYDGTAQE